MACISAGLLPGFHPPVRIDIVPNISLSSQLGVFPGTGAFPRLSSNGSTGYIQTRGSEKDVLVTGCRNGILADRALPMV